jgi:hypothetical protein
VILTDADKALAKELGLTLEDFRLARACHIAPAVWAERMREIAEEREAGRVQEEAVGAALTDHLKYAVRRPDAAAGGPSPEDGNAPA